MGVAILHLLENAFQSSPAKRIPALSLSQVSVWLRVTKNTPRATSITTFNCELPILSQRYHGQGVSGPWKLALMRATFNPRSFSLVLQCAMYADYSLLIVHAYVPSSGEKVALP